MSHGNNIHFTFNFHGPIGQQIAHVDKLETHFDKDMSMQVVDTDAMMNSDEGEAPSLPEILCTPQAEALLAKLRNAGWMDERWNPVGLSNAEKGTLADFLSEKLGIHSIGSFSVGFGTSIPKRSVPQKDEVLIRKRHGISVQNLMTYNLYRTIYADYIRGR